VAQDGRKRLANVSQQYHTHSRPNTLSCSLNNRKYDKHSVTIYVCMYAAKNKMKHSCEARMRVRRPSNSTQIPSRVPKIQPSDYRGAFLLKREKRCIKRIRGEDLWLVPSKMAEDEELDLNFLAQELSESNNFTWERYTKLRSLFWTVEVSENYQGFFKCSCPIGVKDWPCKHAVMLMEKMGLCRYPPDAIAQPFEQKRKSGRPKKATPALEL
jgi:hypothetical protein